WIAEPARSAGGSPPPADGRGYAGRSRERWPGWSVRVARSRAAAGPGSEAGAARHRSKWDARPEASQSARHGGAVSWERWPDGLDEHIAPLVSAIVTAQPQQKLGWQYDRQAINGSRGRLGPDCGGDSLSPARFSRISASAELARGAEREVRASGWPGNA